MQRRPFKSSLLSSLALAAGLSAGAIDPQSSAYGQVFDLLDGHWQGEDVEITIDARRAQARRDRQRPFQWEAFNVSNVEGNMVVFSVGAQVFIGQLSGDELTLTTPGGAWPDLLVRTGRLAR